MYKVKWKLPGLAILLALLVPAPDSSAEKPPQIGVDADSGVYDVRAGAHHLSGNVRITRGSLEVLADEAHSFSSEGRIQRIELYGNPTTWNDVMEDGSDVSGSSDQIVYDFNANIITMIGNAHIRNIQGEFSGPRLTYDLDTQNLVGDGGVRLIIEPEAAGTGG